jgi:hypothetical protein
LKDYEEG